MSPLLAITIIGILAVATIVGIAVWVGLSLGTEVDHKWDKPFL